MIIYISALAYYQLIARCQLLHFRCEIYFPQRSDCLTKWHIADTRTTV